MKCVYEWLFQNKQLNTFTVSYKHLVCAPTLRQPSVSMTSISIYIVIIASVSHMDIKALMSQKDGAKDFLRGDLFCNKERKRNEKLAAIYKMFLFFSFM